MLCKDLFVAFVDKVAVGDAEAAKSAFSAAVTQKAKTVLATESQSSVGIALMEFIGNDSPIRMDRDNILVNGKVVGKVSTSFKTDANGMVDVEGDDSGINFTSADGSLSKEFVDLGALITFIRQKYLGE
jgi:hypothetical protein